VLPLSHPLFTTKGLFLIELCCAIDYCHSVPHSSLVYPITTTVSISRTPTYVHTSVATMFEKEKTTPSTETLSQVPTVTAPTESKEALDAPDAVGFKKEVPLGGDNESLISDTTLVAAHQEGIKPAFLAKATVLNKAIQEIGFGRYQYELFFSGGFGWFADNVSNPSNPMSMSIHVSGDCYCCPCANTDATCRL
jgi:hypothetical protein